MKPLLAVFDQPDSSSDAGSLLLKAADERLGLSRALAACLVDERDAGRVRHSLHELLSQRLQAVAGGYEDVNDAARLRFDAVHQLINGRALGGELASQATLCRFENGVSARDVHRLADSLCQVVLYRRARRARRAVNRITLDVDATWDDAYGEQQGALFNGKYAQHGFLPLVAFATFGSEREQHLLSALLRPGNAGKAGVLSELPQGHRLAR